MGWVVGSVGGLVAEGWWVRVGGCWLVGGGWWSWSWWDVVGVLWYCWCVVVLVGGGWWSWSWWDVVGVLWCCWCVVVLVGGGWGLVVVVAVVEGDDEGLLRYYCG